MKFSKDSQLTKLSQDIERLTRVVSELRAERDSISEQRTLEDRVTNLKKQVSDLEITRDQKQEEFDRRERELTHMIGLEKKRQEVEIEQASQDARLTVREENLQSEREQFESQMEFRAEQFDGQVEYLQDIMKKILNRLPTVSVDRNIVEKEAEDD